MLSSFKEDTRVPIIAGFIVILLLSAAAMYWVLKKDYQPLFSNLSPEDTAKVSEQMSSMELNYRINQENGTLEVPSNQIHDTRLRLMSSDPSINGGVGYEVFDNADFGMTEFAQKINFKRALEGELQRTITSLAQIKHARVHLVMPDRTLFRSNDQEPTASVTLLLREGAQLNQEQITGIQRLVSASVPDLTERMVTISDHQGQTLTQPVPSDKAVQLVPWQLQQKIAAEKHLSDKIIRVLAKAFDTQHIAVSVNIIMDFSQVKKMEEQMLPVADGKAISREKESRLGNKSSSKKSGQNITREVEYKMGRSVAEIVESPGRITQINLGVMLPENLPEEKHQEIQRLIEVTAGINKNRGDSIAVYRYDRKLSNNGDQFFTDNSVLTPAIPEESDKGSDNSGANPTLKPTTSTTLSDRDLLLKTLEQYWIYILVIIALIFILSYLIIRSTISKPEKRLSTDEREKVLMQLQHWLSETK